MLAQLAVSAFNSVGQYAVTVLVLVTAYSCREPVIFSLVAAMTMILIGGIDTLAMPSQPEGLIQYQYTQYRLTVTDWDFFCSRFSDGHIQSVLSCISASYTPLDQQQI